MFPIVLLAVVLLLAVAAIPTLYRLLVRRSRRARDRAQILRRVADLEERRAP